MAGELDAALTELTELIRTIDGLRNVPDESPENPSVYPLGVSAPLEGSWIKESSGQVKGLHTIQLGVYVPRKDLPRDIESIKHFGELVKDKLLSDTTFNWSGTIDTIVNEITYTFGSLDYAGHQLIGWTFRIPVKIKSIESSSGVYTKG